MGLLPYTCQSRCLPAAESAFSSYPVRSGLCHIPPLYAIESATNHLSPALAGVDDCRGRLVLDGASVGASGLDRLDNLLRVVTVSNFAEDDVLAVEPGGHDGGDEELGAVAGAY
jgi:hypothetical protein